MHKDLLPLLLLFSIYCAKTMEIDLFLENNKNNLSETQSMVNDLCDAVIREDDQMIRDALSRNYEYFFIVGKRGYAPFHLAALYGKRYITRTILIYKKDNTSVDCQDKWGCTALQLAVAYGNNDTATILLRCNANPRIKNKNGYTSLHTAAYHDNKNMIKIFIDSGCSIKDKTKYGHLPIELAAQKNNKDSVKILLDCWLKLDSPLRDAIFHKKVNLVNMLVKANADVNACSKTGRHTPLHTAVFLENKNSAEIAKILINADPSLRSTQNDRGDTPLHTSAMLGSNVMIKVLFKSNCNPNLRNHGGDTPIHLFVKHANNHSIEILKYFEKNINEKDKCGGTPLYLALLYKRNTNTIKNLMKSGANLFIGILKVERPIDKILERDYFEGKEYDTTLNLFSYRYPNIENGDYLHNIVKKQDEKRTTTVKNIVQEVVDIPHYPPELIKLIISYNKGDFLIR